MQTLYELKPKKCVSGANLKVRPMRLLVADGFRNLICSRGVLLSLPALICAHLYIVHVSSLYFLGINLFQNIRCCQCDIKRYV